MASFQLRYTLNRRQRIAGELLPWAPAIAGTLGFSLAVVVLSGEVSPAFLVLLFLPLLLYRGLFALLLNLAFRPCVSVEIVVDDTRLEMTSGQDRLVLPLEGIIQVFREGNTWTVLHIDRTMLSIPADVLADEQAEYLKSFARAAAARRKLARPDEAG
jgi:hypothetical protein